MATTVKYDGLMSGSAIATAVNNLSGSNLVAIPYANGQRVIVLHDGLS